MSTLNLLRFIQGRLDPKDAKKWIEEWELEREEKRMANLRMARWTYIENFRPILMDYYYHFGILDKVLEKFWTEEV